MTDWSWIEKMYSPPPIDRGKNVLGVGTTVISRGHQAQKS